MAALSNDEAFDPITSFMKDEGKAMTRRIAFLLVEKVQAKPNMVRRPRIPVNRPIQFFSPDFVMTRCTNGRFWSGGVSPISKLSSSIVLARCPKGSEL